MRWIFLAALAAIASLTASSAPAQPAKDSVEWLVQKLASANFAERQAATDALKKRPEAIAALREAAITGDPEARRRVEHVLEFFSADRVRTLREAGVGGRVEEFIKVMGAWDNGKHEDAAWRELDALAMRLAKLGRAKSRAKLRLWWPDVDYDTELKLPVAVFAASRLSDETKCAAPPGFVRAGEIDCREGEWNTEPRSPLAQAFAIIATGSVRIRPAPGYQVMLAGGPLEMHASKSGVCGSIIVCGGEANLRSDIFGCLVVAKGSVRCAGNVRDSLIVSGKSVAVEGVWKDCIMSENDSNPLGYIRWDDAPKDKDGGKTPAKGGEKKQ